MSGYVSSNLALVYMLLFACQLVSPLESHASWNVSAIDGFAPFTSSTYLDMAVDSSNGLHIIYGKNQLKYAYRANSLWEISIFRDTFRGVTIDLDSNNEPGIIFIQPSSDRIRYRHRDGDSWETEYINAAKSSGDICVLKYDSYDRPHVCFRDDHPDRVLRYMWKDSTGWNSENISIVEVGSNSIDMVLDDSDRPHVVCRFVDSNHLTYAVRNETGWVLETVDKNVGPGACPDIEINFAGDLGIGYCRCSGPDTVVYAQKRDDNWSIHYLDNFWEIDDVSLCFDGMNLPYICYSENNELLKIARFTGSMWEISAVETTDFYTSAVICMAFYDYPMIVFSKKSTGNNRGLFLVSETTSGWNTEMVDGPGDVGHYCSMNLSSSFEPRIAYHDATNGLLKYAESKNGVWTLSVIDGDRAGEGTSIDTDQNDRSHVAYYKAGTRDFCYAWQSEMGWEVVTVDTVGDVGRFASLKLDENNRSHICYYDFTTTSLKYAFGTASEWQLSTIDEVGDVGWYCDIDVDSENNPHIAYADYSNSALKYAYHDGVSWYIDFVDLDHETGWEISLKLDSSDRPHIMYHNSSTITLWYAFRDDMGWHVLNLEQEDGLGASLALDSQDEPHVAYYSNSDGFYYDRLKYSYKNSDSWITQIVAYPVYQVSLLLDQDKNPHLSYSSDGRLYYTVGETGVIADRYDIVPVAEIPSLVSISPNPCRNAASISYILERPGFVSINAYDLSGKFVYRISDRFDGLGESSVFWNPQSLSNGSYLIVLNVDGESRDAKAISVLR